jgi:hypothetical protein
MIEFHGTGSGKYVMDPESRALFLRWSASIKGRWGLRPFRISPKRKTSQSNAHWERCHILGMTEEISAPKEIVSALLMEAAFTTTGDPCYGSYRTIFGKEQFVPTSTTSLTEHEFWQLKREAYSKLQFINDGKEPHEFVKFPERDANGIIAYCILWSERPHI